MQFIEDEAGYTIDDQFYYGSSGILVKPVTTEATTQTTVYLSDAQPYYNYFSYKPIRGSGAIKVNSPPESHPNVHSRWFDIC